MKNETIFRIGGFEIKVVTDESVPKGSAYLICPELLKNGEWKPGHGLENFKGEIEPGKIAVMKQTKK